MRPSKIDLVNAKETDWVNSSFYMMIFGTVYAFDPNLVKKFNATEDNDDRIHETIHVRQAEGLKDSWIRFYLHYFWQWLCNISLITVNIRAPYMFMPTEIEAYGKQDNPDYIWAYDSDGRVHSVCDNWRKLKQVPKKHLKDLAKQWYGGDKNKMTFTQFIKKHFSF